MSSFTFSVFSYSSFVFIAALNVELFNLLRNTVQKLQLPGPDGSTLFMIGGMWLYGFHSIYFFSDAQARLNGRRMHCRSTQTGMYIF
jgi:hypothetical protein